MKKFLFILLGIYGASLSLSLYAQEAKKEKGMVTEETLIPKISVAHNTVYIKNAPANAKLQVITIVGNKVCEFDVNGDGRDELSFPLNLPRGIYIFKLEGMVRKFVIQ